MNTKDVSLLIRAATNKTHNVRLRHSSPDSPRAFRLCAEGLMHANNPVYGGVEFIITDAGRKWLAERKYPHQVTSPTLPSDFLDSIGLADYATLNQTEIAQIARYVSSWRKSRKGSAA